MSTWVNENCVSFFELFCIRVLKTGRIPQHVAFIMDGNRRYAKKHNVQRNTGHSKGFDKLSETLKWCLDLGIPEVTVYAFSIENFKRSDEEVNGLMDLARDKFQKLLDELSQIKEWGVRVHVAGRLSLLPADVRALAARVMLATRHNSQLRLNIAYSYTGRDEISRAASHLVEAVGRGDLDADVIDEGLVGGALELAPPELLVRTSGEVRLSDFMLWQLSDCVLYFTETLWPEFSIWELLAAVLYFQRNAPPAKTTNPATSSTPATSPTPASSTAPATSAARFLERLEETRFKQLEAMAGLVISS